METSASRVQPKTHEIPLCFKPKRGLDAKGLELFRLAEESYCRLFLMRLDLAAPVTAGEIAKEAGRRGALLEALAIFCPLRNSELGELSQVEGWLENIRYAITERSRVTRKKEKARSPKIKVR